MTKNRAINPAHPGDFIRTEIIEPLGLDVSKAADALQVTRPALSAMLNGRSKLSIEMAIRIEKAFGVSMDTLLRMQYNFDIAEAKARAGEIKVTRYKAPGGRSVAP